MTRRADQDAKAAPNGAAMPPAGGVPACLHSPLSIPRIDPANVLGAARSYADLGRILADHCEQIGMSRATLTPRRS